MLSFDPSKSVASVQDENIAARKIIALRTISATMAKHGIKISYQTVAEVLARA